MNLGKAKSWGQEREGQWREKEKGKNGIEMDGVCGERREENSPASSAVGVMKKYPSNPMYYVQMK